jgi:hypothetical protein
MDRVSDLLFPIRPNAHPKLDQLHIDLLVILRFGCDLPIKPPVEVLNDSNFHRLLFMIA